MTTINTMTTMVRIVVVVNDDGTCVGGGGAGRGGYSCW